MRKHSRRKSPVCLSDPVPNRAHCSIPGPLPDTTAPLSHEPQASARVSSSKTFSLTIETHITIYAKVELSRKQVGLLLEQEVLRVSQVGFCLLDWFSFEWMINYLGDNFLVRSFRLNLVSSREKKEVNLTGKPSSPSKLFSVIELAKLILRSYTENSNLLYDRVPLQNKVAQLIKETLGELSDRTHQGRSPVYAPEKFLVVKIEDVRNSLLERRTNSTRYTSYCKGYGESGRSVRKQRTRYSDELDRERRSDDLPENNISSELSTFESRLFGLQAELFEKGKR
jgi:hypothetical protein